MSSGINLLINDSKTKILKRPYLIGISGGSGGGKTSVANLIHKSLGRNNSLLFSMDSYYKDLTPEQEKNLSNYNFDSPEALDLDLVYEHLNDLMHWKKVKIPTYDFSTNKRQSKSIDLEPAKIIIVEGILAFYDERMRNLMDLKLFIDLDDDIRLSRRIYRDIISRGRKMETVLERYHKFVKTAYNNYIKPTKEFADIIIPRGGSNTIAIDLINYHLKYLIGNAIFKNEQGEIMGKNNLKEEGIDENLVKKENVDYKETIDSLDKKEVFCEDEKRCLVKKEEEDMFLEMLKLYLSNDKYQYFDLFIDIYAKKIKDAFEEGDLIIFSNDDESKVELILKERIDKIKNEKRSINVFYFIPILFEKNQKQENIIKKLKETEHINKIKIISVFSDSSCFEDLLSDNIFLIKAIYSGIKIPSYNNYIKNYGFYLKNDDENSYNLISLSEDNFERRLLGLIDADNKKDNLSIINNYNEEE